MTTINELARRLQSAMMRGQFTDWRKMYTGRRTSTGITLAGADTGKTWVRAEEDSREETQVWGSASRVNLPVWVGPNIAGELELKTLEQTEAAMTAGAAAAASLLPTITPENSPNILIDGRQFRPGRLRLSDLGGLYVYAEPFQYDGGYWPGGNLALTPPGTSSTQAWCAVAFNPADGALYQFTGAEYALPVLLTDNELGAISITPGYIPLGGVVLQNGQTTITGAETWGDLRYHFAQAGGDISGVVLIAPESSTRNVIQPTGDYTPLTVKGDASQTDTLFEAQDSSGTVLAKIAADGDITAPDITATGTATSVTLDVNGSGTIQKLLTDASTELTIASGAVTVTQTFHRVDTEADAASDDLTTINGGTDGQFLVIRAENTAREVVVTTAGNITTSDGNNVSLDELYKFVLLIYDGNRSKWNVVGGGGGASGTYYQTVKDNGSAMTQRAAINFHAGTDMTVTVADDAGNDETDVTIAFSGTITPPYSLCQGRLTLTSGAPVTTSDVTAATTLYFAPYKGNQIGLYNGSAWEMKTFSELSLSLSGYTADKNYDIWAYNNSGTVALESTVWTNDTTRATAVALQDGVYVKSGTVTRRYLGTIRTTSTTGQCEDSETKRFVWNNHHREHRALRRLETVDNWTYSTATTRQANGNAANQVEVVIGVEETMVSLWLGSVFSVSVVGGVGAVGIGYDSTTTFAPGPIAAVNVVQVAGGFASISVAMSHYPAIGWHRYVWLERGNGSGTNTWLGGSSIRAQGLMGFINA